MPRLPDCARRRDHQAEPARRRTLVGPPDPSVSQRTVRVTVHEPLEFTVLASDLGFTEGPVIADDGTVYAVDIHGGRIIKVVAGDVTVVATPGGGPNGMAPETDT